LSIANIKAAVEMAEERDRFLEQKEVEAKAKKAAEEAIELEISQMTFEYSQYVDNN
jgi:hypothetical protein